MHILLAKGAETFIKLYGEYKYALLTFVMRSESMEAFAYKGLGVPSVPSSSMPEFISHYVDALAVTSVTNVAPIP